MGRKLKTCLKLTIMMVLLGTEAIGSVQKSPAEDTTFSARPASSGSPVAAGNAIPAASGGSIQQSSVTTHKAPTKHD